MSDSAPAGDAGYDEWADALADTGYYLTCPAGHGSLPPRRVCPECGDDSLSEESLPGTGEVVTFSEVHVAPLDFAEQTPYVTAVVEFGPVRLTGVVRGVDAAELQIGTRVSVDVTRNEATGNRLVAFSPE